MMSGEHTTPVEHRTEDQQCGHTKLFMDSFRGPERLEPCIFCEREQLRAQSERLKLTLGDAADMLHECARECSDCDYGNGATGRSSEGGVCEECAPVREAERRAREVLS
jgi:hypothetical protein